VGKAEKITNQDLRDQACLPVGRESRVIKVKWKMEKG
jgi:hypothetical protein